MNKNKLNEPYQFENDVVIKNKMVLAPMTTCQSNEDGTISAEELQWLSLRAKGGFGTLITACSHVQKSGKGYPGQLGCFDDIHIEGLSELAAMTSKSGAASILQLFHGGLRSPGSVTGVRPTAPSEVHLNFQRFEAPRALTIPEIIQIIEDFALAAERAVKAGLSGIELHAANGYLFSQFLSTITNQRADEWGGSFENRTRFLYETVKLIRRRVPQSFIIGVRLVAEDSVHQKGFNIDETCEIAAHLAVLGADYIHLALGNIRTTSWSYPDSPVTNLLRIKTAVSTAIAVIACGGIQTEHDAAFAIEQGADLVALGKTAIGNPEWPNRVNDIHFSPRMMPMSPEELTLAGVSVPFLDYLYSFNLVRN